MRCRHVTHMHTCLCCMRLGIPVSLSSQRLCAQPHACATARACLHVFTVMCMIPPAVPLAVWFLAQRAAMRAHDATILIVCAVIDLPWPAC